MNMSQFLKKVYGKFDELGKLSVPRYSPIYAVVMQESADKQGETVRVAIWSYRRPAKGQKYETFYTMDALDNFCALNKLYKRESL